MDANVNLRYLLSNHPEFSEKARKTIAEGGYTLPEVIAEVVYVLKRVYKIERSEIRSAIGDFMDEVAVDNQEIIVTKTGYGREQMQMYRDARGSSSKRFCKPHRMMLVQGDIKYGPKLPIGKNGARVQTYLSSAINDHSCLLLASRFYDSQKEAIVEDTFRQAILRYGKFDACYFDNGSQYIAR